MKKCYLGLLFYLSLQFTHAQTAAQTQNILVSPGDDASFYVINDGNGIRKRKLTPAGTPAGKASINEKKKYIVEFRERPLLLEKKNKRSFSGISHQARFTEFSRDVNNLYQKQKRKAASPRIGKQFQKVFFGAEVELTPELAASLRQLSYVKKVSEVQRVEALLDQSISLIKADAVWNQFGNRGEGITVGIIDTGIDYNHPALGGGLGSNYKVTGGYDFVNNDNDPMDDHGHGTHCAGIVGGDGVNIQGVAPKVNLAALKVLGANGSGFTTDIIAAIEWAADPNQDGDYSDKLDILSLSLGGPGDCDDATSAAVDHAVELGIVVCVAAGNSHDNFKISSPGTARKAITVGASDYNGNIANFSSKGPNTKIFSIKPEVVAPGVDINSTVPGGGMDSKSGTSMATPHVAGIVALLRSLHPGWTTDQVKSALMTTALDLGTGAMSQGAGQVNALKAAMSSTFVSPSHISLGILAGTGTQTEYDTLMVINADTVAKTYSSAIAGAVNGLAVIATPSTFTLAPGSTQQVVFTLTADHNTLPISNDPSGSYSGKLMLTSARDTLCVPWAFMKTGKLLLTFDSPNPALFIYGSTGLISATTFINDGYAAEIFMNPDTIDILYARQFETLVFREKVAFTGADSIHISENEAVHTVTLQAVDENNQPLNGTSQFMQISFPAPSLYAPSNNVQVLGASATTLNMSSFSNRYQFTVSQRKADINGTGIIYNIQHPTLEGLQQSLTLTNTPASLISQDITLISPDDSLSYLWTGTSFTDRQKHLITWSFLTGNFTGSWSGRVYQSQTDPFADQIGVSVTAATVDYPLVNNQPLIAAPPLIPSGTGISPSYNSPVKPIDYVSPSGHSLVFGRGIYFPYYPTGNPWDANFYGKFREYLNFENTRAEYRLFDQGVAIDSGNLKSLNASKLLPGKNHLEITLKPSWAAHMKGTYTAKFDLAGNDGTSLFPNSFQVRNGDGVPSDTLELGEYASLQFSLPTGFNDKHLFVKPHAAETWQELKLVKISEETSGSGIFGYLYEARLATFDTVGPVDVRIAATTQEASEMEWKVEHAFVLKDDIQPTIVLLKDLMPFAHTGTYDFGGVALNQSSVPVTFSIVNNGTDPLRLSGNPIISLSSGSTAFFQINTNATDTSILPGDTTTFTVTFAAAQPGVRTDTLRITNNASTNNPFLIVLKGHSTGPEMDVKISNIAVASGGAFQYATQSAGTSYMRTVTIENKGSVNLNLTGTPKVQISGTDASSFLISQSLPATLAPNTSATFIIQFSPQTPGMKTALVSIANNDDDESPYTFTLQGQAVSGDIHVELAGSEVVHASVIPMDSLLPGQTPVTRTFIIENLGDGPLGFYSTPKISVTGTHASDFIVNHSGVPSQLLPGNTASFTVSFSPQGGEGGLRTAEIRINSSDYNEATFRFTVQGVVPAPEAHVVYFSLNIANGTGSFPMAATNVGRSGPKYRFTLMNNGAAPLTFNGQPPIYVYGQDSLDFAVDHSEIPVSIAAGSSAYFYVTFVPTAHGPRTARIAISGNDLDEAPYTFKVSGEGLNPEIDVQQAGITIPSGTGSYDFGNVSNGNSSAPVTFDILNTGYTTLTLYGSPIVYKASGDLSDFTIIQSGIPATIGAGASASFTVTFSPVSAGPKNLQLRIQNSDTDEFLYAFSVKGNTSTMMASARMAGTKRESSTSITEERTQNVAAFPNPSKHGFTLYFPGKGNETVRLKIYNAMGTLIAEDLLLADVYHTRGEDWRPGIYFMEVTGGTREVIKLIKE